MPFPSKYTCTIIHTHTHMYAHICTYACVHTHMYAHTYTWTQQLSSAVVSLERSVDQLRSQEEDWRCRAEVAGTQLVAFQQERERERDELQGQMEVSGGGGRKGGREGGRNVGRRRKTGEREGGREGGDSLHY